MIPADHARREASDVTPREGRDEGSAEEVGQEEREEEVEITARPADAGGEVRRPRRGAILVARDDRGRVLLVRQRGGPFKGEWFLPGGGLEAGESFEDALRREVTEETGLDVIEARPIARYRVRAKGLEFDVVLFSGSVTPGEPRVGADGEACAWTESDAVQHPVVLRELRDAGAIEMDEGVIAARLDAAGIAMRAL